MSERWQKGGRNEPQSGQGRGRGTGRGRLAPGLRPVTESTRINIREQLETFQKSDQTGILEPKASAAGLVILSQAVLTKPFEDILKCRSWAAGISMLCMS